MSNKGELDGALLAARCLPIAMLKTDSDGEVVEMRHQPTDRLWPNALVPLYLAPTFTDGEVAAIKDCATLASAQGGECFKRAAATLRGLLDRAVDPGS